MIERLYSVIASNFGTKMISVMIAIVLWIIVLGSRNIEELKEVPIEVITASDVTVSNDVPDRVQFKLKGPKAFLRAIRDRREEPLKVNIATAKPGHLITYNIFGSSLRLPPSVQVTSVYPSALLIKLEYVKKREVPVKIDFRGQPPDGFRVGRSELKPKTVRIKGAESRVDSIVEIPTMPIDLGSIRGTLEREQAIDIGRYNVQLDSPLPRIFVQLEAMTANYRIKNVDIRYRSSLKVKLDDKSVTVWVRAKDTSRLDRSHVFADIDLSDLAKGMHAVPVRVNLPDDVSLVKVIPDHVGVTLY